MVDKAEFQWSTYLVVIALAGAGYVGWAVYPAYMDNLALSQAIHAICNEAWRHEGKGSIEKKLMDEIGKIGTHTDNSEPGQPTEVPGLPVDENEVVITCTDRALDCTEENGNVTISVPYVRRMPLPYWKGKFITLHFKPTVTESLKAANWN